MAEPFVGEIRMLGFNFPPRSWALCNGQLLQISSNSALFSLLGTAFGGDGRTTFALPDLQGRIAKHVGDGPGLIPVAWGQRGGAEEKLLTVNEIPSHQHILPANASEEPPNATEPNGNGFAAGSYYRSDEINQRTLPTETGLTGGSQAFDMRNPYLGIYHAIALVGIFPSRS